ncbi:MAG: rhodanese-like domain-containing protein [Gemmatimonadaceae bacterium]
MIPITLLRSHRAFGRIGTLATVALLTACHQAPRTTLGAPVGTPPSSQMLVSTAWLDSHRNDADVVVLQVGTKAQYDSGHVAGARFVALSEIAEPPVPNGLTLQMAPVPQLVAWAQANGIGDRTRVIIVPHDENLQSATRVFFTLAYLGAFDRASVVNGSFKAWKAEGRATTTAAPAAAVPATFTARPIPQLIATLSQVEAVAKDSGRTALIDARLARFYNGDGGGYPRPGHIPTAVNVPLNTVSTNGFMKPASELKTLFTAAGVRGDTPIITYCHIGQQATVLWFVATLLGYEARMFDGSFQEWSGTARLPVVAPPGAK